MKKKPQPKKIAAKDAAKKPAIPKKAIRQAPLSAIRSIDELEDVPRPSKKVSKVSALKKQAAKVSKISSAPTSEKSTVRKIQNPSPPPAQPFVPQQPSPYEDLGELPDSYGTGRLFFVARDPHWIYAAWDYTWQQMEDMRRSARHGELKLRVYAGQDSGCPIHQELTINHGARSWFVHAGRPHADFYAEFGFYNHDGHFVVTSRSFPTHTPADRLSDNTGSRFVTIPFHISFQELFEMVKAYFLHAEELADVLYRLQRAGFPFPFDYERLDLDEFDDESLIKMFGQDLYRRIRMGSEELTEWLKKRFSEMPGSPSSPFGASFGVPRERGFWFNVNAELIIYGATEPDAKVTFDGKDVNLNPDGTFRFQFALPDGSFPIPVSATSADGVETRSVDLNFSRNTKEQGGVGAVAQPEDLPVPPQIH